jgi:hypothetical protein
MTTEEIQALVDSAVKTALEQNTETLKGEFNQSLSGLAARLTKELNSDVEKRFTDYKPQTPKEDEQALAYKALQEELNVIKTEREQEKQSAAQVRRDKAVLESVGSLNVNNSKVFRKLFLAEFGSQITEENNQFFLSSGDSTKPLNKAMEDFLNSEDGKLFQPASSVNGSGSKPSNKTVVAEKQSLSSLMSQALKKK